MKVSTFICLLITLSIHSFSQVTIQDPVPFPKNYYDHPVFTKGREYSKAYDWANAEKYWTEFSSRYPAERPGYLELGSVKLALSKHSEGELLLEQAHIMNPIDIRTVGEYIMACAINGNIKKSHELAVQLALLSTSQNYTYYNDYFSSQLSRYTGNSKVVLNNVINKYKVTYQAKGSFDPHSNTLNKIIMKKGASWDEIINNLKQFKTTLLQRGIKVGAYHWLVKDMYDYVEYKYGLNNVVADQLITIMLDEYKNTSDINPYYKVYFGTKQYDQYLGKSDYDRAYAINSLLIAEAKEQKQKFQYNLIDLYIKRARLLYLMSRFNEFETLSSSLTQVLNKYKNPLFKAEAYEAIALMNSRKGDLNKGIEYGKKALSLIQKHKLVGESRVKSLLTIIYSNKGDIETALKYSGFGTEKNSYMAMNNIGSILEDNERYEEAIEYYNKSINKFNVEIKDSPADKKLTMLSNINPLYGGLATCYQKLNNHKQAFEAIENSKSRLLSEALDLKRTTAFTPSQLQSKLANDEVYISYKMNGKAHFIVSIVTKTDIISGTFSLFNLIRPLKKHFSNELKALDVELSQKEFRPSEYKIVSPNTKQENIPINHGDIELIIELLRKHLTGKLGDYIKTSPTSVNQIGNTLSSSFYNSFVHIIHELDAVKSKTKFIISADGALNFVPFDALLDNKGQYMASTHSIKMTPSASVWLQLKGRNYPNTRKDIIAFGGAIYEEPQSNAVQVSSLKEINEWQLKSYELVKQAKPLTDLFKALGYGKMNYLAGTLAEVNEIGKIYPNSSKIITGTNMTEKKVKDLSATNVLKNYKVIHFATHGWAMNAMPKVSGLAMCIPKISTDGEDGTIVAKELSQLKLNADMVMLSACETGLGKLYGGEGVSGLNQALLIAGANSTIVTLWPVDDYATSVLVKELYKISKEENLSFDKALFKVKQNFISGKYNTTTRNLQAPIYWAPFVYNGQ